MADSFCDCPLTMTLWEGLGETDLVSPSCLRHSLFAFGGIGGSPCGAVVTVVVVVSGFSLLATISIRTVALFCNCRSFFLGRAEKIVRLKNLTNSSAQQ